MTEVSNMHAFAKILDAYRQNHNKIHIHVT